MNIAVYQWQDLTEQERSALLRRPAFSQADAVRAGAAAIIGAVRQRGDAALAEFTERFDGAGDVVFKVSAAEVADATRQLQSADIDAIELAIANVRRFHEQQRPVPISIETMPGVICERVSRPVDSVGLYVPAGTAPLPSAAIMLAVPAIVASCPQVILCTPPRADGTADPAVLVAATRAGVDEIYKIGGAQAIAAMAYGTESIPKVRKIFGPGNLWVTSAKTIVSCDPEGAAIDMPAGPSEVLVVGDETSSPELVAADLLSQAEHGVDSQVVLVTTDAALTVSVQAEIEQQLESLSRSDIAAAALENSLFIVAPDLATALEISNRYAPEHLILQIRDARAALDSIRNAGSVFLGPWTPESVGDYCSGANHVLPTYGYAATYSGLGVEHYLRHMTVQELSRDGLTNIAGATIRLAGLEGLDAHAKAVSRRLMNQP
jgi:histidinol dehydrogenase